MMASRAQYIQKFTRAGVYKSGLIANLTPLYTDLTHFKLILSSWCHWAKYSAIPIECYLISVAMNANLYNESIRQWISLLMYFASTFGAYVTSVIHLCDPEEARVKSNAHAVISQRAQ